MAADDQSDLFDNEGVGDPQVARSLLDQLLVDAKLYRTTESFKTLLDTVARLRNVAPFNAMLLQLQKPGITHVASAYDWFTRFNRCVKEDARPLLILWPFGPVATVYDVLDTYDPKNPRDQGVPEYLASFLATGEMTEPRIRSFGNLLDNRKIEVRWIDRGDAAAGEIRTVRRGDEKEPPGYLVKLNINHTPAVQFSTLVHELGHLCLGHLGSNTQLNIPRRRPLSRSDVEIEAESVAYLVCQRNGIDPNSHNYLSDFVDNNTNVERLDLYQITRAAGLVETLLQLSRHTKFQPTTERLIEKT